MRRLYEKDGVQKLLASLLSILIGLTVGAVVIAIVGLTKQTIGIKGMWDGIRIIYAGILSTGREAGKLTWGFNPQNLGNMLFRATPLILTGLSVAIANKTGLFNIGAAGQYLMGTMATLMIALSIPAGTLPGWIVWLLAFLGGMIAGGLWGAIPGALKALLNINEVLACIMTNWLAANIVTWAFDVSNFKNVAEGTKTGYIYKTTFNGVSTPKLGLDKLFPNSQVNGGILVAIVIAVIVYIIMNKTTLGYQLTPWLQPFLRYDAYREQATWESAKTIYSVVSNFTLHKNLMFQLQYNFVHDKPYVRDRKYNELKALFYIRF